VFPDARQTAPDAVRVGLWLLRAGIAAGLLCLAAGGRAHASDSFESEDPATRLLLAPQLDADAARAREARDLLDVDRNRKIAVISSALVELGIRATFGASPVKLLHSAGELGQGVLAWSDRTRGEEKALLLLAPGALGGELDEGTRELYERLAGRERGALVKGLLDDGKRALALGQTRRARIAARRALELDPTSERADSLLEAIAARAKADEAHFAFGDLTPGAESLTFAAWDVRLATSLLTDGEQSDSPADCDEATRGLARATARYEAGARAEALEELRRIAELDGDAAAIARHVLEDRGVNPERALDDEIFSYTKRRSLGVLGGQPLADNGLTFEPDNVQFSEEGFDRIKKSYKVFRKTVNPVNLMVDAPARLLRDWRPEGGALREAARRYLALEPEGARADDAREWLMELGPDERASATVTPFRDGYFVLPHARTRYARVAPGRVVVSLDALQRHAPELVDELGLTGATGFVFGEAALGEAAESLANARALELLDRLADGLEAGDLRARGQDVGAVLEAVRRLDRRVRAGATLRVAPRLPDVAATSLSEMGAALVDGKRLRTVGDISVIRKEEDIIAGREIGGAGDAFCLPETPCIDRKLAVDGSVFARTEGGDSAGIGAAAGFREARLTVEVGTSGPRANLVLPVARWLGITHLLPIQAHVGVGLDGISAGPQVDDTAAEQAEESL